MKTCSTDDSAITLVGKSNSNNTLMHSHSIKVECKCRNPFFWKLQRVKYMENEMILQDYKCATVSTKIKYFKFNELFK